MRRHYICPFPIDDALSGFALYQRDSSNMGAAMAFDARP